MDASSLAGAPSDVRADLEVTGDFAVNADFAVNEFRLLSCMKEVPGTEVVPGVVVSSKLFTGRLYGFRGKVPFVLSVSWLAFTGDW